ncbi:hypothetical protein E0L21_00990 [Kosakonia quasisacchari]|uniref:Uncharacterized protein n=1 Tax=Kosakonia quasisacchari TaxID=2529380 RepID=A0A4R0HSZ8_9ENTR|nr:hypothetical protein E0L21_00990 [Kosakonia quasisacchari]
MFGGHITYVAREREKGAPPRSPFSIPRGPAGKSVLRTALTSRTSACGRLDSRLLVPSLGLAPSGPALALFKIAPGNFVMSRLASGRLPWRPDLAICAAVRRFRAGTQPHCCKGSA